MAKKQIRFRTLKREAERNGWTIPHNNIFPESAWIAYWDQCRLYKKGLIEGRPIAPHRSGGGN